MNDAGQDVGGNVPLLQLDGDRINGNAVVLTTEVITKGSEFGGSFTMVYNDQSVDSNPQVLCWKW